MTRILVHATAIAWIALGAACGDDAVIMRDASVAIDSETGDSPDLEPGPCGEDSLLSAELVDVDHGMAAPAAIAGATFTALLDPTRTTTSAVDGHVELCVPVPHDTLDLEFDAPDDYLDGFLSVSIYAAQQASGWGPMFVRTLTSDRAAELYSTQFGVSFDSTRAQVLVFNACDGDLADLDRPHDPPQASPGYANEVPVWEPGNAGHYVLFPNVDVTEPTGVTSSSFGSITIPLEAGRLTIAVQCTVYI